MPKHEKKNSTTNLTTEDTSLVSTLVSPLPVSRGLGWPEAVVIIVIIVLAAALTVCGMALKPLLLMLLGAGLVSATLIVLVTAKASRRVLAGLRAVLSLA